jgi:hypothetical protein
MSTQPFDGKLRRPSVVHERLHGDFGPAIISVVPMQHRRGDSVMAVGEDVSLDLYGIADNPLDREYTVVDAGRDILDDDARSAIATAIKENRGGRLGIAHHGIQLDGAGTANVVPRGRDYTG